MALAKSLPIPGPPLLSALPTTGWWEEEREAVLKSNHLKVSQRQKPFPFFYFPPFSVSFYKTVWAQRHINLFVQNYSTNLPLYCSDGNLQKMEYSLDCQNLAVTAPTSLDYFAPAIS